MAHGYAKIEGKPLGVFAHSTVGLQHAAMAIFNAYCDRVPVYLVLGTRSTLPSEDRAWNGTTASKMRPLWSAITSSGTTCRSRCTHFAESAVRAYKIAMTPPSMPVLLVADAELQENPMGENAGLRIPKLTLPSPPQGDSGAVAEVARLLTAAENPVIIVDRTARTAAGVTLLVELAETLQAPVVDLAARMNFPTRHPLNHI